MLIYDNYFLRLGSVLDMHSVGDYRADKPNVLGDEKHRRVLLRSRDSTSSSTASSPTIVVATNSIVLVEPSAHGAAVPGLRRKQPELAATPHAFATPAERHPRRPHERLLRHVRGHQRHRVEFPSRGRGRRRAQGYSGRYRRRSKTTPLCRSRAYCPHQRGYL